MKKLATHKTWSGIAWEPFEFRQYTLGVKILDYKLRSREQPEVTVRQILERFRQEPFESVEAFHQSVVIQQAEDKEVAFGGNSFTTHLVALLLSLQKEEVNPFETSWFCYDWPHCLQDVMDRYVFFVVHDNKIVRERVSLTDYRESGFDPGLFEPSSEYSPIWSDEEAEEEARAAYWYKKFYTETTTGQMCILSNRLRPFKTEQEIAMAHTNQLAVRLTGLLLVVIVFLALIAVRLWF